MIILKEQVGVQTLQFTVNGTTATSIVLIDEETSVETEVDCTFTSSKYYIQTSVALDVLENKYYTIKVKNNNDVVYTGLAFCTNQTIEDYTINKDAYVEHTTDNEFIIYE